MTDKHLTGVEWKKFSKGRELKDAALLKAFAAFEGAKDPGAVLAALDEIDKQADLLRKANKADKELSAYLDEAGKAAAKERKLAEAEAKKAAQEEAGDDEEDSPALLTTAMGPLLRQVRKGVPMKALVALAGKDTAVLLSRRSIAPTRRKLLQEYLGGGAARFVLGECIWEENAHTFVLQTQAAGLAKKLKAALLAQTQMRAKVRVRGESPEDIDDDGEAPEPEEAEGLAAGAATVAAGAAASAAAAAAATATTQAAHEPPDPHDAQARAFNARLAGLMPGIKQALVAAGPDAGALKAKVSDAGTHARNKEFAQANALLDDAEQMMAGPSAAASSAASAAAAPALPEGQARVRQAIADGTLAAELAKPEVKSKVVEWAKGMSSAGPADIADLLAVFRADVIADADLLDATLKHTTISREEAEATASFKKLPAFKRKQILDKYRETPQAAAQRVEDEDKAKGERFLSSEYRIVNPLLAALEELGVDPAAHQMPDYDYRPIEAKLMAAWKRIAIARGSSPVTVETWDGDNLKETYGVIRSMARVWDKYEAPEIPGGAVTRGDTGAFMYGAYPFLDPVKQGYPDGELALAKTITWPGVMSTTVGNPKDHNFIQAKSFIWKFQTRTPHKGRIIGSINPAEQEVTFPVGSRVVIEKLIVRVHDKTLHAAEFGSVAEVIALARLE